MSCKGNKGSCGCKSLPDVSDEDLEKERMRRVAERDKRRSEAKQRRAWFLSREYPMRFFWIGLPLLPVIIFFALENLLPRVAADHHRFFIYGTLFLTCVFVLIATCKEMSMEEEFRKCFPEDAKALAFKEYEEW